MVIDPRRDCGVYPDIAAGEGYRITDIIETHRNEDYLAGSVALAGISGADIWHAESQLGYEYGQPVEDGQEWGLGDMALRAVHTPGHTPGSFSYILHEPAGEPWMLFCGDALFAGEVGRVDLLGADSIPEMARMLHASLFEKLLPAGDGVLLCPAHGYGSVCGSSIADREWTTIGLERRLNPVLRLSDPEAFVVEVGRLLDYPPYFRRMEEMNLAGPAAPPPLPPMVGPEEAAVLARDALVIDTRSELEFNAAHIPGSLSIWAGGLSAFAGWFLPYGQPLLLVADGEEGARDSCRQLTRMGFDSVAGILYGGMLSWHKAGRESEAAGMVTVNELCRMLDSGERLSILDVRSRSELERQGRIPGAIEIELKLLPGRLSEVPGGGTVYIFCGSGLRSTTAASLLQRDGEHDVAVVLGGFAGWSSTTCPIER